MPFCLSYSLQCHLLDYDDMADGRADPTTKLFSLVKQFSDDEDDGEDEEDEDGDDTLILEPTVCHLA